jgi:hypothetical protein
MTTTVKWTLKFADWVLFDKMYLGDDNKNVFPCQAVITRIITAPEEAPPYVPRYADFGQGLILPTVYLRSLIFDIAAPNGGFMLSANECYPVSGDDWLTGHDVGDTLYFYATLQKISLGGFYLFGGLEKTFTNMNKHGIFCEFSYWPRFIAEIVNGLPLDVLKLLREKINVPEDERFSGMMAYPDDFTCSALNYAISVAEIKAGIEIDRNEGD